MSSNLGEWSAAKALEFERHVMRNDPLAMGLRVMVYEAVRTKFAQPTVDELRQVLQPFTPVNGSLTIRTTVAEDYEFCWQDENRHLYFTITRIELAQQMFNETAEFKEEGRFEYE